MVYTVVYFLILFRIGCAHAQPASLPTPPNAFVARVEANINNRWYSEYSKIWYNRTENQIAVYTDNGGSRFLDLYRFNTDEYYHVDRNSGICEVHRLSSAPLFFLFGSQNHDGTVTIKTPKQFFSFSENAIQWINQTVVRGITCDLWRQPPSLNTPGTSFTLDWYLSALNWDTPTLSKRLPIRAHVYGNVQMQNNAKRSFDHMYEFIDISLDPQDPEMYQTPVGVYCPGAKNIKPLPVMTSSIHFTSEILDHVGKTISRTEEWYSYDMKLMMYEAMSSLVDGGITPLTTVHDFNTGRAYVMDKLRGNCTVSLISALSFDDTRVDADHVKLSTANALFYLNIGHYIYEGKRTVRGIKCDVWITQTNTWPTEGSSNSTFEWYFTTSDFITNLPDQPLSGIPVRLVLKSDIGLHYTYNIYDFNDEVVPLEIFDITLCSKEKKELSFLLPGSYRDVVLNKVGPFKSLVRNAILKAGSTTQTSLDPLRVTYIQIDYEDTNDIIVEFTLLEKSQLKGDVVNPLSEASLDVVISSITNTIDSGKLVVAVGQPNWNHTSVLTAKPNSLSVQNLTFYNPSDSNEFGEI